MQVGGGHGLHPLSLAHEVLSLHDHPRAVGDAGDEVSAASEVDDAGEDALAARASALIESGLSTNDAAKALAAEARIPRKRAYEIVLAARERA